jgi:hypothetical protein
VEKPSAKSTQARNKLEEDVAARDDNVDGGKENATAAVATTRPRRTAAKEPVKRSSSSSASAPANEPAELVRSSSNESLQV